MKTNLFFQAISLLDSPRVLREFQEGYAEHIRLTDKFADHILFLGFNFLEPDGLIQLSYSVCRLKKDYVYQQEFHKAHNLIVEDLSNTPDLNELSYLRLSRSQLAYLEIQMAVYQHLQKIVNKDEDENMDDAVDRLIRHVKKDIAARYARQQRAEYQELLRNSKQKIF